MLRIASVDELQRAKNARVQEGIPMMSKTPTAKRTGSAEPLQDDAEHVSAPRDIAVTFEQGSNCLYARGCCLCGSADDIRYCPAAIIAFADPAGVGTSLEGLRP